MATIDNATISKQAIVLAIVSGLLQSAAFPKIDLPWVAWCALVPILLAIKDLPPRHGFRIGLLSGCVHYLTLLYWLADTMKTYGGLPGYVYLPVLFLMALYLSLFTAGSTYLLCRFFKGGIGVTLMVPVIWVSQEYLRSILFTGFPWEMLGHSQYQALRIIQISDIFGVYGITFLLASANVCLFLLWQWIRNATWQETAIQQYHVLGAGLVFGVMFSGVWLYGGHRLADINRKMAVAPAPGVAVIQGNIDQAVKWDPAFRLQTAEKYIRLSQSRASENPALLVWPETATPFYFMNEHRYSPLVRRGIRRIGADFIIGSPAFERRGAAVGYRNRAYLVTADGNITGHYDKVHLVPFGEYVPLSKWLPFMGKMVNGVGDFEPGEAGGTLAWGPYRLGMQICYEMIFPGLSRQMVKNGATCIVNITNDAWYGTSSAPYQLFSMSVFRAVENRRAVVRAANTGISGFIDPTGRIVKATDLFEDAALTCPVPMLSETSIYTRWGDLLAWMCLAVAAAGICLLGIRNAGLLKKQ